MISFMTDVIGIHDEIFVGKGNTYMLYIINTFGGVQNLKGEVYASVYPSGTLAGLCARAAERHVQ